MAVMLLLALMLTTVTVSLDSLLPSSRGESAARQFLSVLDLARTSAVAHGRNYEIEIELEAGRYRIVTPFGDDGQPAAQKEDRNTMNWNELADGVSFGSILNSGGRYFEEGTFIVTFDPMGSSEDLHVYLHNEAGEGYTLTVRILALTGHSKVFQGEILPETAAEDDFL